ncbi:hypothetical protein SEA_BRAN_57 [Corynebacterium phage Bran]|nr:hypothetical protein SEA_BRAN_57 [Corynebacterium phage Bran]
MTPDEARDLLDGTTPGPWEVDTESTVEASIWSPSVIVIGPYYDREDAERWETGTPEDLRLAAAAPVLAAMIAGMREEWGIVATYMGRHEVEEWGFDTRDGAESVGTTLGVEHRIVRRYVTNEEEIS